MKKLVLVVFIGLLVSTAVFADHEGFGIGVVGGGGWSGYGLGWGALSLKLPSVPIFWALSFPYAGNDGFNIGIIGDYYIIDKSLVAKDMTNEDGTYKFKLDWYFGVGGFIYTYFSNNYVENLNYPTDKRVTKGSVDFGLRVPVGLSWHIIKQLELFLAVVPGFGVWAYPDWNREKDLHQREDGSTYWTGEYYTRWNAHPFIGAEIGLRFWF
jgi:hypothetical protein